MPQFNINDIDLTNAQVNALKNLLSEHGIDIKSRSGWMQEPAKPVLMKELMDRMRIKRINYSIRTDNPVKAWINSNTIQICISYGTSKGYAMIPSSKLEFESNEELMLEFRDMYFRVMNGERTRTLDVSRYDQSVLSRIESTVTYLMSQLKGRGVTDRELRNAI